jgi:signal peptidase I
MHIKKLFKTIIKGFSLVLITIALAIIMQVFLFASFKVPTDSMEPTIKPGDFVYVNKLLLGPRIYRNLGFLKGPLTPFKRLKGLQNIRRNDVFVFNAPNTFTGTLKPSPNLYYVKRCVAIPGDMFAIENGIYQVQGYLKPLGNYSNQMLLAQTPDKAFDANPENCFPNDTAYHWTIKHFGPLYIPGKGDRLDLNPQNIVLYRSLIQYETEKKITIKEEQLFLGEDSISSYTFTKNYYFMAGDNVFGSQDSRYWGFLPEDFIVGKATLIWKSEDPFTGKMRWNRFLKKIRM